MPTFEPVTKERPVTASHLIEVEVARLRDRKARLQEGLAAHSRVALTPLALVATRSA